jgi:hypothetical protein
MPSASASRSFYRNTNGKQQLDHKAVAHVHVLGKFVACPVRKMPR